MADCKLFAMCSASSPCMPLQARKSMRLEPETRDMWVLTSDRKKPLTASHWGQSDAISLLSAYYSNNQKTSTLMSLMKSVLLKIFTDVQ